MWQVPELYTPLHKGDRFVKAHKGGFVRDLYVGPNHKSLENVQNKIEKGAIDALTATTEILPPKPRDKNRPSSPSRAKSNMAVYVPKKINSFTQSFEIPISGSPKKGKAPLKLLRKSASEGGIRTLVRTPVSRKEAMENSGTVLRATVINPEPLPVKPLTPITDVVTELNEMETAPNTIETADAGSPDATAPTLKPVPDRLPESEVMPALEPLEAPGSPAEPTALAETPSSPPAVVMPVQGLETPSVVLSPMNGLNVNLIGEVNAPVSFVEDVESDAEAQRELANFSSTFECAVSIPLGTSDGDRLPGTTDSRQTASGGKTVRQSNLELGEPTTTFQIHTQMGGWKVNLVGRHNDHNMQRISKAIKSVNELNIRKSPSKAPRDDTNVPLRALIMTSPCGSPNTSQVLSQSEVEGFGVIPSTVVSEGALGDASPGSLNLSPGGDASLPGLVVSTGRSLVDEIQDDLSGAGEYLVESGREGGPDSTASSLPFVSTPGNTYQRSANLSQASTDADALDGEFIDSLDYVNGVPRSIDRESTDSVTSEVSFANTRSHAKSKLFGGGFTNQPYQVHNRIMGWKLTSLPKRNKIVKMLDKIAEIPTSEMVDLSYSRVVFPTDTEKISKKLSMTDRSDTGLSELAPTVTLSYEQPYAIPDPLDPDQRPMVNAMQSRTLNRVWSADPRNHNPASFAESSASTGYGHLSEREILAIEKDVSRRLDAFARTSRGKADKIKRIIDDARRESEAAMQDRSLLNLNKPDLTQKEKERQAVLLQRYLVKEREKAAMANKKPKSLLQMDLLRQRDRSEILFAAKQITTQMMHKHNSEIIHQLDVTLNGSRQAAVAKEEEQDPLAGLTLGLTGGGDVLESDGTTVNTALSSNTTANQCNVSRSALWSSVARPPPVAKVVTPSMTFKNVEAMGAAMQYGETIPSRPVLSALHPLHVPTPSASSIGLAAATMGFTPNAGSRQMTDRSALSQSDSELRVKDLAYVQGVQSEPYLQYISQPGTPKTLSRPASARVKSRPASAKQSSRPGSPQSTLGSARPTSPKLILSRPVSGTGGTKPIAGVVSVQQQE